MKRWWMLAVVSILIVLAIIQIRGLFSAPVALKERRSALPQSMLAEKFAWRFMDKNQVLGDCFSGRAILTAQGNWRLTIRPHGAVNFLNKKYIWSSDSAMVFPLKKILVLQSVSLRESQNTLRATTATLNFISQSVLCRQASMVVGSIRLRSEFASLDHKGWALTGHVRIDNNDFVAMVDKLRIGNNSDFVQLQGVHHAQAGRKRIRANEIRINLRNGQWRAVGQVQSEIDI